MARALDILGDKWTLVLVGHLLRGSKGFQDLRVRTGIAPRVLSSRLRKLQADGFVETEAQGSRSVYAVTARGRRLEPIVAALARWWVLDAVDDRDRDFGTFTETSPLSILESLPFLLREEAAREADVTFEIRLTGEGGGVWSVRILRGSCTVRAGFAEHAEVRYTADARAWCRLALGFLPGRDAYRQGLLQKDGSREAMDHYFYQIAKPEPAASPGDAGDGETRSQP
ncbi:MAG: helix-turn-helix domain-containing protein [Myxococcota bacterium]